MTSDELEAIWLDIDYQSSQQNRIYQRLIYVDLLYRAYIGSTDMPARRFLSIEIPKEAEERFAAFYVPQGILLKICEPAVKHEGYFACILQAASSDQNDVFTIVAKDILDDLRRQKTADLYIDALKFRIEKWKDFFKNPKQKYLNDETVIGLIGELSFIKDLHADGIYFGEELWNGPIRAAQDFQGNKLAIEVKTCLGNIIDSINISSEVQLDDEGRDYLFLVVYRVERDDVKGNRLPDYINTVSALLTETQRTQFYAKLTCIGYASENEAYYTKGFVIRGKKVYLVNKGFPRITVNDLPKGVSKIRYKVDLTSCCEYEIDFDKISLAVKELEYGQN